MAEIDAEQRHELELMIRELETENATLQVRTIYIFKPKSGIFHQNLAELYSAYIEIKTDAG